MFVKLPVLSYPDGKSTYDTLHLFSQIAGKIKMTRLPWINHSWHVTLYVSAAGLTTLSMPAEGSYFSIDFDLLRHSADIRTSGRTLAIVSLIGLSVSEFYRQLLAFLKDMGIDCSITKFPCEIEGAVPFDTDDIHKGYTPVHAADLHKALLFSNDVFTKFRAGFLGKCSPVHFFWGSFDLAVTRFSGKKAPQHPGGIPHLADRIVQEAYSHEVSSAGFWPGNEAVPFAAYYSYAYPEPEGYSDYKIEPVEAYYHPELREFILPYEAVRQAPDPEEYLLRFLESTYAAAAELGGWDREALEKL